MARHWIFLVLLVAGARSVRVTRQTECEWWDTECLKENGPTTSTTTPKPTTIATTTKNGSKNGSPLPGSSQQLKGINGAQCPVEAVCVPYYQCKDGEIIQDGEGIIDIRQKPSRPVPVAPRSQLVGGNCPGVTEVCCRVPPGAQVPEPLPVGPPTKQIHTSVCGVRNSDGLNIRITGFKENEAQYGEFPWMVAVLKPAVNPEGKPVDFYQCGGSLVHPQVVLTAAHCVAKKDPKSLKVRLGEWDTQTEDEFFPQQDIAVVDIVIHEEFYSPAVHNDFALLFLAAPVNLGPEADTICLPRPTDVYDGSRCFVSGWGKDLFGQVGKYQVILKKIELPIVPFPPCLEALRKTRLGPLFNLHKSFLCAGGEPGKDACKGDGGSPLVCPIEGVSNPRRYVQVGIVAWGIGCGEPIPAVYANVMYASTWIQEKIVSRMKLIPDYFAKQLPV